ncbi:recombinase family protein [Pseudonocardia sp. NPDC049635]|uniref:recombinase family protein n=1 Tax=Pseudonocardia sp. NPDC049635 TaxID=3155506 RepID=UPI0033DF3D23
MTVRAAVYVRISQDRTGAGLGVERQEADCRALAERLGWTVARVFVDNDVSAYSGKSRPQYRALLDAIEAGQVDGVLCWHTDRLHRSPVELEQWITTCEPRSIPTHTVQAGALDLTTSQGRMIARISGAVARHESEHKADRIRAARRQAATQGRWSGGVRPFGFEADGVTIRATEAAEIVKASEAIVAGTGVRTIVREWNDRGLRTTFGAHEWTHTALRDVLMRPRNAGLMGYLGEIVGPASWPAIVPEATWRAVCSTLTDPARRTAPGNQPRWLGSGLYQCGVCGRPELRVGQNGRKKYPAYRCRLRENGRTSGHVLRRADVLDSFVERLIVARLSRPDALDLIEPELDGMDTTALHAEQLSVSQRLDDLAAAFADGAVTLGQLQTATERLRARQDEIGRDLAAAAQTDPLVGVVGTPDVASLWFGTREDRADGLPLGRRRAILDALVTITVHRTQPGRRTFDPSSIGVEWKRALPGDEPAAT